MMAEVPNPDPRYSTPDRGSLEAFMLTILEQNDGLCLDNETERTRLTGALSVALLESWTIIRVEVG